MSEQKKINIKNKRATFDYEILEEWVAGVVLVGTEIKSIRAGKASMVDSYCYFDRGELWIRGVNIAEYAWGTCNNHTPRRDRKLLLTGRELQKLERASQDKGLKLLHDNRCAEDESDTDNQLEKQRCFTEQVLFPSAFLRRENRLGALLAIIKDGYSCQ